MPAAQGKKKEKGEDVQRRDRTAKKKKKKEARGTARTEGIGGKALRGKRGEKEDLFVQKRKGEPETQMLCIFRGETKRSPDQRRKKGKISVVDKEKKKSGRQLARTLAGQKAF